MTVDLTAPRAQRRQYPAVPPPPQRRRPTAARPTWSTAAAVVLPAAATAVIGWQEIGTRNLWQDELITWHAASLDLPGLNHLVGNIDLVHVAYYLLTRAWTTVAGDTPAAMRLPSLIAMVLATALIVLMGRRLSSTAVGVTAGLLFAALPSVSRHAQEARSYALVTASAALATWLLLRALERYRRTRWMLYGGALLVTGLLHPVGLMVLAGHAAFVLTTTRHDTNADRRWDWTVSAAGSLLPLLPILVWAQRQSTDTSWITSDAGAVRRFATQLLGDWRVAALVTAVALLTAVLRRRTAPTLVAPLLIWAAVPPVVAYLTNPFAHLFLARYHLFTLPAWCLLAAAGLVAAGDRLRGLAAWARLLPAVTAVAAVAVLGLDAHASLRVPGADGLPDYAAAMAFIRSHATPGDGIAFNDGAGHATDTARMSAAYVFRDATAPRDVFLAQPARDRGWLTATQCRDPEPCLGETTRIWLVETGHPTDPFGGLPEAYASLLRDRFTVARTESFNRVRVLLLVRSGN